MNVAKMLAFIDHPNTPDPSGADVFGVRIWQRMKYQQYNREPLEYIYVVEYNGKRWQYDRDGFDYANEQKPYINRSQLVRIKNILANETLFALQLMESDRIVRNIDPDVLGIYLLYAYLKRDPRCQTLAQLASINH